VWTGLSSVQWQAVVNTVMLIRAPQRERHLVRISVSLYAILTEVFRGFSQPLHASDAIVL